MNKLHILLLSATAILSAACGMGTKENKEAAADPATGGNSRDIGVALYSFNRFPFPEALDKAKQAGATYVEGFSFHKLGPEFQNPVVELEAPEVEKLKGMLSERGLQMPSMYSAAKNMEEWAALFETGKKLGLEFFVAEPEPELWDALDSLAGASGIKIAIHEHAKGKSRFWHPDSVLAALEGHPNFGACGDVGHWTRSGLDPVECLSRLEGHLLGIHAKDLDRAEIEAEDVKVGDGIIDFKAVMGELERQGFTGPVYVECEHDMENNFEDVKFAVEFLRKL